MTYTSVKSSGAEVGPQPNSLWSNSIGENFAIVLFLSLSLLRARSFSTPRTPSHAPPLGLSVARQAVPWATADDGENVLSLESSSRIDLHQVDLA